MSESDSERIRELEARVSYLERELEMSYEDERFERLVKKVAPSSDTDYCIVENAMGHHKAELYVSPEMVRQVASSVDREENLGWHVDGSTDGRVTVVIAEGLHHR